MHNKIHLVRSDSLTRASFQDMLLTDAWRVFARRLEDMIGQAARGLESVAPDQLMHIQGRLSAYRAVAALPAILLTELPSNVPTP